MSEFQGSGECINCGRYYVLRKDGTVRGHSESRWVGSDGARWGHFIKVPCPGSFQKPRGVRS